MSEGEENITHRARKSKEEENITHRVRKRRISHTERGRGEYHTQSEEESITKSEGEENITHRTSVVQGRYEYHTQGDYDATMS